MIDLIQTMFLGVLEAMEALIGRTHDQSDGRRDSAQPLLDQAYQYPVVASKVRGEPNEGASNLVSHTNLDDGPTHRYLDAQDAP